MDFFTSLAMFWIVLIASYLVVREVVAAKGLYTESNEGIEFTNIVCLDTYAKAKAIGLHVDAVNSDSLASQVIMLRRRDEVMEQLKQEKSTKK
ncbi:hypothetical protein PCIT_a3061 [Pseudoalteromonas citrea]|uniref:Uncharacterized protein n=2 Tax=Pseudoalteromonas citrea TaxID=43655 RepID=A0AAD4AI19_9GAMM|nr:hypothetical protein [Pseudoalteromonas citrea]KAF7770102.1 hypothetical protein PCIT_a3061 [Pseudoalteromonas citrea]